mmetsp:Transcript_153975/g.295224  ORF Transcript_153975/g.295224 Transcript_153975/m.295224 type:complete len:103 (+) Transcript_153975:1-309(+)
MLMMIVMRALLQRALCLLKFRLENATLPPRIIVNYCGERALSIISRLQISNFALICQVQWVSLDSQELLHCINQLELVVKASWKNSLKSTLAQKYICTTTAA